MHTSNLGTLSFPRGSHLPKSLSNQRRHTIWEMGRAKSKVHWPIRDPQANRQGGIRTCSTTEFVLRISGVLRLHVEELRARWIA